MLGLLGNQLGALIIGTALVIFGLFFVADYVAKLVLYIRVLRATDSDMMSVSPGDRVSVTGRISSHPYYGELPLQFSKDGESSCLHVDWNIRRAGYRWHWVSNGNNGVVMTLTSNGRTFTVDYDDSDDVVMLSDPEPILYISSEDSRSVYDFVKMHDSVSGDYDTWRNGKSRVRYSMFEDGDEIRVIGTVVESEHDSMSRYTLTGDYTGFFGLSRLFMTDMSRDRIVFEMVKAGVGLALSVFFVSAGFVFGSYQIITVPFGEYAPQMLFIAIAIEYAYMYAKDLYLLFVEKFPFTEYLPFTNQ